MDDVHGAVAAVASGRWLLSIAVLIVVLAGGTVWNLQIWAARVAIERSLDADIAELHVRIDSIVEAVNSLAGPTTSVPAARLVVYPMEDDDGP